MQLGTPLSQALTTIQNELQSSCHYLNINKLRCFQTNPAQNIIFLTEVN